MDVLNSSVQSVIASRTTNEKEIVTRECNWMQGYNSHLVLEQV